MTKQLLKSMRIAMWIVVVIVIVATAYLLGMRSITQVRDAAYQSGYDQAIFDISDGLNLTEIETESTALPVEIPQIDNLISGTIKDVSTESFILDTDPLILENNTEFPPQTITVIVNKDTEITSIIPTEIDVSVEELSPVSPRKETVNFSDLKTGDRVTIKTLDDPNTGTVSTDVIVLSGSVL